MSKELKCFLCMVIGILGLVLLNWSAFVIYEAIPPGIDSSGNKQITAFEGMVLLIQLVFSIFFGGVAIYSGGCFVEAMTETS